MLLDTIQADLATAQKARDQVKVDCLRFLLGAIFNYQIEKYPPSVGGSLTDNDVIAVVKKLVKQHEESIVMFTQGKRQDLVDREKAELAILQAYLPAQMSDQELAAKVAAVKSANPGADFGTLMKKAMGELQGIADGALVAKLIRESSFYVFMLWLGF